MHERFLRELMKMVKCSTCGRRYAAADVNVMGRQGDLWYVTLSCSHCHAQAVVAAVLKERKVETPITDLTEEEQERFRESAPVGPDEVLDMHDFLKDFDGDFSRLFKTGK